jgi:hypothetical protein
VRGQSSNSGVSEVVESGVEQETACSALKLLGFNLVEM